MRANPDPPATTGVYGPKLGRKFGAEYAPFIVTRTLQRGEIAVTELLRGPAARTLVRPASTA
jgi:hypothetical protein